MSFTTNNSKSANVPLWKLWKLDGNQFLCSGIEILSLRLLLISAKQGFNNFWLVEYGSAVCIMWYLCLIIQVGEPLMAFWDVLLCFPIIHWCCIYKLQSYKRLICPMVGPAEVVAYPRPCDLILQPRKPVVFLLPSSVNYRHKAFSGLSSHTIHVLVAFHLEHWFSLSATKMRI